MGSVDVAHRDRIAIFDRLRARRVEIEEAVRARVYAIADPGEVADPGYAEGLRIAISAAVDYGLQGLERGDGRPPPVPPALLAQARFAARNGVNLDTVLRRYFGGYLVLGDFVMEEAESYGLERPALKRLLRSQAAAFDRLVGEISEDHGREEVDPPDTSERRRQELVQQLLSGRRRDAPGLAYDLNAVHIGLLAEGEGADEALAAVARELDRRLLAVHPDRQTIWAWLGGRRALDPEALSRTLASVWPPGALLAIGEPGEGLAGWRFTHWQACAALTVALRGGAEQVRYAEVALLSAVLQDEVLTSSLRRMYLAPLEEARDGGKAMRATLRAYFAAGRQVSSTAAALGVTRNTVTNRLNAVESMLGQSISSCVVELEVALRLPTI
jgi:hypothetical protein